MIYYIDPINGADSDGLSPENARLTYDDIELLPGDSVLFKRGSIIRQPLYRKSGTPDAYITYGAYGEGTNPVFCGSVDVSDPEMWVEEYTNVWRYVGVLENEVCNFIFDGGRIGATLRWDEDGLTSQGDWHDTEFGARGSTSLSESRRVLLYSVGNPGRVYSHIECAIWGIRNLSPNVSCTTLEDLIFFGSGVHALSDGTTNMTVRRCSFLYIGGAVWNRERRIRFGNAIEFWQIGRDILIEDCYFNNIYDSAMTHQGSSDECEPAINLVMRRNLCINCGMASYEGRDVMSIDSAFSDNLCINAGGGFSAFGDSKPRRSEIYPLPMGHHIYMWRIESATDGGRFEVKRNRFYDATGCAIFSINSRDADAQMELADNRYYTTDKLLTRIGGVEYKSDEFERYVAEGGEIGAELVIPDIEAEAEAWFESSGCGRFTERLFSEKVLEMNNTI